MRYLKATAPLCSYYFMDGTADPPETPKEFDKAIAKLQGAVDAIETKLETATGDTSQWQTTLQTLQQAIADLQVNSLNTTEAHQTRIQALETQVQDLLIRTPPAPPAQEPPNPPNSEPPASVDGINPIASAPIAPPNAPAAEPPPAPQTPSKKKRVV